MGFLNSVIHRRAAASSSNAISTASSFKTTRDKRPHLWRARSTSSSRRHSLVAEEIIHRHLIIVSDTPTFSSQLISRFQAEGFEVTYLPFLSAEDAKRDRMALEDLVREKEDELEHGERFAIVAYHRPAYLLLASHHLDASSANPFPRLCALVANDPLPLHIEPTTVTESKENQSVERIERTEEEDASSPRRPACMSTETIFSPPTTTTYLPIQIHIANDSIGETDVGGACASSLSWISTSPYKDDSTYKKRHRCYIFDYTRNKPTFAEPGLDCIEDGDISSRLAWSRVLSCLRRSFGMGKDWPVDGVENSWEEYWNKLLGGKRQSESEESAIESLVGYMPRLSGGKIISSPESFHIGLLSRTVGPDRIVDEILVSFRHTAEIPWLLPGVMPTNCDVHFVIVVMASFCADKIVSQNVYWDQANVLAQVGLLDRRFARKET
ncbi:Uncharacterized protein PECH_004554 [Penicillium ucsense]|uniref:Dienelactone hydrolase n=1 Tax=Penicillium ucsense TaxID=2839758 RepID=A0A8J8VYQ7_9EURO|nr:Uncharacterized protein PECM_004095 [Penicillium ucsense]KAF7726556.1 Uncharacterized protein PECH_004554 [Penicillium ucsense]